jgi:hypothetical protein
LQDRAAKRSGPDSEGVPECVARTMDCFIHGAGERHPHEGCCVNPFPGYTGKGLRTESRPQWA